MNWRLLVPFVAAAILGVPLPSQAQADADYFGLMRQCQAAGGTMWADGRCLHCPYGLSGGSGPARCADRPQPSPWQRPTSTEAGQYAQRPAGMPTGQQDPGYCARTAHSASALNNCVVHQNQEFVPTPEQVQRYGPAMPLPGGGTSAQRFQQYQTQQQQDRCNNRQIYGGPPC